MKKLALLPFFALFLFACSGSSPEQSPPPPLEDEEETTPPIEDLLPEQTPPPVQDELPGQSPSLVEDEEETTPSFFDKKMACHQEGRYFSSWFLESYSRSSPEVLSVTYEPLVDSCVAMVMWNENAGLSDRRWCEAIDIFTRRTYAQEIETISNRFCLNAKNRILEDSLSSQ